MKRVGETDTATEAAVEASWTNEPGRPPIPNDSGKSGTPKADPAPSYDRK